MMTCWNTRKKVQCARGLERLMIVSGTTAMWSWLAALMLCLCVPGDGIDYAYPVIKVADVAAPVCLGAFLGRGLMALGLPKYGTRTK